MSIENKDPTISIVNCAFEETDAKQNKTMGITEIKPSKSNDSSINTLSSNECRSPPSIYNNDALSRRPSSLNLGKSAAYSAVSDVSSSPILSELLTSINNNNNNSDNNQHHQNQSPPSYSLENSILIIIMPNSIIDKDTTLTNIEKQEFKIIDQHSLQLSSSQVDIFYSHEESTTKAHYEQLFDDWKEISLSEKVQVVLLEKENALNSFQSLLTTQNSIKKKNRIIDPLSIYASISQENTKKDIELLLKPVWDTQKSNNLGESVSSASFVLPSGTYENHDAVIHYASKEKLVVIDGKSNIENNEEKSYNNNNEKVSAAIASLKLNAKKSNASLKNSIRMDNHQQLPITLPTEKDENIKKDNDTITITTTIMKQGSNKDYETKQEQSSSSSLTSIFIKENSSDYHLLIDEKSTINNNNNNNIKEDFNYSETSTVTKASDTIKNDSDTTETNKNDIIINSNSNTIMDTSEEGSKVSIDENAKSTIDTEKEVIDTEKEVIDTSIATSDVISNLEKANDLPINQNILKESYDDDEEKKKIENKNLINDTNPTIKAKEVASDKQKPKFFDESKTPNNNKKIENRKDRSPPKYGSIKKKSLASQKQVINHDKANKLITSNIPTVRSKTKDDNKTNETTADKPNNKNRIPRVALLANDKTKKNRTTTGLSDTITTTTEESPSSSSSHEKKKTNNKSATKPKKATTSSAIARLTAPTESSARRKQSIVNGKVVSSTTIISTTTMTEKPSSTTAFIRLEGKKRIPSVSKKESSLPMSKPLPPVPSSVTIKKDEDNNNKKDDPKQTLKKPSIENTLSEPENGNNKEQYLEIKISQDNLNPINTISSTNNKEVQDNNDDVDDDNDKYNKSNSKNIIKEEPLSPQSPESSSTSSRPRTPPQQEESNTNVTFDTVNITMKQGDNSRVKDMLQRFT